MVSSWYPQTARLAGFDLNGDGVLDASELRSVLQHVRDVGSAISDEMIGMLVEQMDTNQESRKQEDE